MPITLLHNAHIYTGDPRHPWAEALAVVDGRVVALDAAARGWASAAGAASEDMGGATLIPGLADAHIHTLWYARGLSELDVRGATRAGMLAQVAERAAATPPGTWITGREWDQNLWEDKSFPTAADLDRVAPAHPVALIAKSAHALVVNSAALRCAKVGSDISDPPHGKWGRDAHGAPDGMAFEDAMLVIEAAIPALDLPATVEALDAAQQRLLALGITAIHDVDGGLAFAGFQELHRQGRLRLRVVKYVRLDVFEAVVATGLRSGYGDDRLRFGGIKLFADGALGARTAAMFAPYAGEPENVGILTFEPEHLNEITRRAVRAGLALAIHAIGDRANHVVLDALEAAGVAASPLRHRVEHVQLITPADRQRLARLGLVASMQPVHAVHDYAMAERYWGARCADAYAWRAVQDAGAVLAFGTDAPIERVEPFPGLYAAVTRRAANGAPGLGAAGPAGWRPEQRLTLAETLRAYTWGAAYAAGMENRLGLLAPGYYADLLALDRDIFALPPEALLETQVRGVMIQGQWEVRR